MYDRLEIGRGNGVVTLTLARPNKLNAFDGPLVEQLIAALMDASATGARLVVFRGAGKGFSGGFDFTGVEEASDGDLVLRFLRIEHLLQSVHGAPFATMALVHGACFGAAADLVASCCYRIAAPGTRFRMPGLRFGVVLGTRRLAEVIGRDNALGLLAESRVFDAEEALRRGFLTSIAAQDTWETLVSNAARTTAALPAESLTSLLHATRPDHRDSDLAALARSIAAPGLKQRILDYLASQR